MKNTFDSETWHENLHFRWIVLPVLAHLFSWIAGWAGIILLFPILITVAQYSLFRIHPAVARPGYWFITLPITFFIWVKWGPALTFSKPNGIYSGVAAYYAGQLINSLFIPLIIKEWRSEYLLRWIIGMIAAATVWLGLYGLVENNFPADKLSPAGGLAMFVVYPVIALIANGISSFFFLKKEQA